MSQQNRATTDPLRRVAEELETRFLAETLKSAGFGAREGSFGGGVGESQFISFLVEAQAREISAAGGFGIAEAIFNLLKERENVD